MKAKLKEDMKLAMKAQEKLRLGVIRGILSALQYEEMQASVEDLPEDKCIAIAKNEAKKRKESLEFMPAERKEEIDIINAELKIIEEYLPGQISGAALETIIVNIKDSVPNANMGLVMKALKDNHFGQYDAEEASELAKKLCA